MSANEKLAKAICDARCQPLQDLSDEELADALVSRGVRVVPADAVVVTESELANAIHLTIGSPFDEFPDDSPGSETCRDRAAAIFAALREEER